MAASSSKSRAGERLARWVSPDGGTDSALRMLQALSLAVVGVVVGRLMVTGALPIKALLLLAPFILAGIVILARYPMLLAYLLLPIFYANAEGVFGLKTGLPTGVALFALSLGYYLILAFTNNLKILLPLSSKLFFLFCVVATFQVSLMPDRHEGHYEDWIRNMLYTLSAFFMSHLLLTTRERVEKLAVILTWTGTLLAVVNIIEFFDRGLINLSVTPTRSAGLLMNANPSAAAILAAYWISYFAPQRFLLIKRLIMFVGIYTTFSRAGLILYFGILFYLEIFAQRLNMRRLVLSLSFIALVVVMASFGRVLVEATNDPMVAKTYTRVVNIVEGNFDDASSAQRRRVIPLQFERFKERPLFGWGAGAAGGEDSPHNQFLLIAVEHGLLGVLLFVIFTASMVAEILRMPKSPIRSQLIALCLFQVGNMVFSHNLMTFRFFTQVFALLCIMPVVYRLAEQPRVAGETTTSPVLPVWKLRGSRSAPTRLLERGSGVASTAPALQPGGAET